MVTQPVSEPLDPLLMASPHRLPPIMLCWWVVCRHTPSSSLFPLLALLHLSVCPLLWLWSPVTVLLPTSRASPRSLDVRPSGHLTQELLPPLGVSASLLGITSFSFPFLCGQCFSVPRLFWTLPSACLAFILLFPSAASPMPTPPTALTDTHTTGLFIYRRTIFPVQFQPPPSSPESLW